ASRAALSAASRSNAMNAPRSFFFSMTSASALTRSSLFSFPARISLAASAADISVRLSCACTGAAREMAAAIAIPILSFMTGLPSGSGGRVAAALDLIQQRPALRRPAQLSPRAHRSHAAVRAIAELRRRLAELGDRFVHRHRLRAPAEPKHPADRLGDLAVRILAVLGVVERASRRLFERAHVQRHQVVDVDVRPDILAAADVHPGAVFFRQRNQPRYLDA